ncbi:hypothetical protein HK097_002431 [Rhizophlyctis rosea]|uniref:Uncharacterized protein n=1 Tax=Rhizophlyctis rosea TaxID=64517 RepID=A0AAD5SGG3_9FUNG|nr:hypothetical protein HK097_002431 [Rhizophlyctis rosea]
MSAYNHGETTHGVHTSAPYVNSSTALSGGDPQRNANTRASHATISYDTPVAAPKEGVIGGPNNGWGNGTPNTTVFLQPLASPQALGLAAWGSALFVFAAYMAEWYGTNQTGTVIWPFLLAFGGFGQFAAGMWSFRSRDTLSSVLHTMWGAFWTALSLYYLTLAIRQGNNIGNSQNVTIPTITDHIQAFAIWQVPVAAFTWAACMASLFRDWYSMSTLALVATGSTLSVIGWFAPSEAVVKIAAYFWLASSLAMWYRVLHHFVRNETRGEHRFGGLLPTYRHHHRDVYTNPSGEPGITRGEW